jgi:hypothetical protein
MNLNNSCLKCTVKLANQTHKKDKIQKQLDFTCQECRSIYQLLEIHQTVNSCSHQCLTQWKSLLHNYYQEQIILFLAQQEQKKDQNHDQ